MSKTLFPSFYDVQLSVNLLTLYFLDILSKSEHSSYKDILHINIA